MPLNGNALTFEEVRSIIFFYFTAEILVCFLGNKEHIKLVITHTLRGLQNNVLLN